MKWVEEVDRLARSNRGEGADRLAGPNRVEEMKRVDRPAFWRRSEMLRPDGLNPTEGAPMDHSPADGIVLFPWGFIQIKMTIVLPFS